MLNNVLLITAILIVVALLVYIFFWNRIVGYILSVALRVAYWNQAGDSAWIEIGSIHFSLIAGRLLLKDVRYYTDSQTIKIIKGQILWRYWIRAPANEEDLSHGRTEGEQYHNKYGDRPTSCRLHASVEGFEWFLYNRTTAYDNIVAQMERHAKDRGFADQDDVAQFRKSFADTPEPAPTPLPTAAHSNGPVSRWLRSLVDSISGQLPDLDPKSLLPFSFEALKGSIICGNPSTPTVLVAEFKRTEGIYGLVPSRSSFDHHKQMLNLKFENVSISFTENTRYKEPQFTTGAKVDERITLMNSSISSKHRSFSFYSFLKQWRAAKLKSLFTDPKTPSRSRFRPNATHPGAFFRKQPSHDPEDGPSGVDSASVEYAIERKILEAPILELAYYVDSVGHVPANQEQVEADGFDIGNGDVNPEWGLNLVIHGGFLRYGPWADRQRAELQRTFFPSSYQDGKPTSYLTPGDRRVWPLLKIFVELRGGTTLYIPFREASKNWQWDGETRTSSYPRPRKREAAWLNIRAGDDSTISYMMPMVTTTTVYQPLLEVHLDTIAVSTSLNDIRILTSETCRVQGNMTTPLKWNAERDWRFSISLRQPVLYLLREHINMFTDLGKDWSSGPPSNFSTWIPMHYTVNLDMTNYELNLYVNDHNIIDKPLVRDENTLITLRGRLLRNTNTLPFTKFRSYYTDISFFLDLPGVDLDLTLPRWSSHKLPPAESVKKLGQAGMFRLDGTYHYFSDVQEDNIEQLVLNMTAKDVIFKAVGWSIRYFMTLQQNYLGSFTTFSTLNEYVHKLDKGYPRSDPIDLKYRPGKISICQYRKSNAMQTEVYLSVDSFTMMLPAGLPGYEKHYAERDQNPLDVDHGRCVLLNIPDIELQLRLHNHFMEMTTNLGRISGSVLTSCTDRAFFSAAKRPISDEAFFIDGINILANRLFGPMPRTSTYVCIWELNIGAIKGRMPIVDGKIILACLDAFIINFSDPLDAPAPDFALPVDPDITFVKLGVDSLDLTCTVDSVAFQALLPQGVQLDSNDLCGKTYRNVRSIRVPTIQVRLLQKYGRHGHWIETGSCSLDVATDVYARPPGWEKSGEAQRAFIAAQDELTRRTEYLYQPQSRRRRAFTKDGLYTTALWLPRPRLSASNSVPRAKYNVRSDTTSAKHSAHPSHAHTSETESDGAYMEPDRLSRSLPPRSFAHRPQVHSDNDSMSSGDESDTGDLTDPSMSDSSWDDEEESELPAKPDPISQAYARYVGHYAADRRPPSEWEASSFKLVKDQKLPALHHDQDSSAPVQLRHDHLALYPDDPERCDSTTIRLRIQSVDIVVTPLCPSTSLRLVEEAAFDTISAEIAIDKALASSIRSYVGSPPASRHSIYSVWLSSLRLRFLHVPSHEALSERIHDMDSPALVMTSAFINGLQVEAETLQAGKKTRCNVCGSASRIGVSLDVLHSAHHTGGAGNDVDRILDISLFSPVVSVVSRTVRCHWDRLLIGLDHIAPQTMMTTAMVYQDSAARAFATYKERLDQHHAMKRLRVYRLLKWAEAHSSVDPSSTTQPSFLVSRGKPSQLRKDARFTTLTYLRNCLHFLSPQEIITMRETRSTSVDPVALDEILALLRSRLPSLRPDTESALRFDQSTLGELLLPSSSSTDQPPDLSASAIPYGTLEIAFTGVAFDIWDPAHAAPCELVVGPLKMTICAQDQEMVGTGTLKMSKDSKTARDKARRKLLYVLFSLTLDDIDVFIVPHVLNFAQRLVRLRRDIAPATTDASLAPKPPSPSRMLSDPIFADLTVSLKRIRLQAAAERLIIAYDASALAFVSTVALKPVASTQARWDISTNTSVLFDSIALAARSAMESDAQNTLASVAITQAKVNGLVRLEPSQNIHVRGAIGVDSIRFSVPRSAIRLVKFVQEWRAGYLPALESTINAILSDVRPSSATSKRSTSRNRVPQKRSPIIQLQASASTIGVFLHVMPGTWLSWEAFNIITYAQCLMTSSRKMTRSFGFRIGSSIASISSVESSGTDPSTAKRIKLDLPSLNITGHLGEKGINALVSLGLFYLTVKPSYWDILLSVQQKAGQDFNDLLHFIANARPGGPRTGSSPKQSSSLSSSGLHTVMVRLQGFRIGLEGHASTVYLECQNINGGMSTEGRGTWNTNVTGLALSLSPLAAGRMDREAFSRNHRSVFLVMDIILRYDNLDNKKSLSINVTKVHAVMQPSSIGEIGDFVDHLQTEVSSQKDERARQLSDFKEKTRNVMRTFEVKSRDTRTDQNAPSFLAEYGITIVVRNIGAAFPLSLDEGLEIPRGKGPQNEHIAVPAFLFYIKSLEFNAERMGSGEATMIGFSFQFVDRFRQAVPSDFNGETHSTRNRLSYPDMTAHIRTEQTATSRRLRIGANVSGFVLDVDSSIPDYVFSLVDVYRRGKERLDKLALNAPRDSEIHNRAKRSASISSTAPSTLPTTNIILSLIFLSGKVRMHNEARPTTLRARSFHDTLPRLASVSSGEAFNLPVVTVWGEYRASATTHDDATMPVVPPSLVMKSTVHSSENTLRPSLLPFLSSVLHRVEERLRKASWRHPPSSAVHRPLTPPGPSEPRYEAVFGGSSLQITFALRIDQSKLQLTCQPDVNVVAGINWDSGGFVINVASHTRQVSFMGNVGGLTIGLKHGFLSEDCVRLDARDLTFSVTLSKHENAAKDRAMSSISVVLDTEVSGGVRFSRLQDVLCFKAVWLDRIPVFSAGPSQSADVSSQPTERSLQSVASTAPAKQELATAILVRVRRVAVEVDLGQSITFLTLDVHDIDFRTKIHNQLSELSLSVGDIDLKAAGNIAGSAHIPNFIFETVRRTDVGQDSSDPGERMLNLSLRSGALEAVLESDYQKILQLWAEPFEVSIFDDWSQLAPNIPQEDRRLRLSFLVSGSQLLAIATVGTIPKLMSYSSKFMANLQAQKEGASRESKAFRIARSPKPDNPLSTVANAMIVSAGTKLKEAQNSVSYIIRQEMCFRLKALRLVVFPRSMTDFEAARFTVRDVYATLNRLSESGAVPAKRELRLAFSAMNTSRLVHINHSAVVAKNISDGREWLKELIRRAQENSIFDMPSMTIFMETWETNEGKGKTINYNFNSQFVRSKETKSQEDIYITLNVSLYSWLTQLRKNLTREMDQVQTSADWRAVVASGPQGPLQPAVKLSSPVDGFQSESQSPLQSPLIRSPSAKEPVRKVPTPATSWDETPPPSKATSPPTSPRIKESPSTAAAPASGFESPTSVAQATSITAGTRPGVVYRAHDRHIERLNMRQLGEATPDVMHPFFMKKAGFSLEDSLPQYVHEYATTPVEEIIRVLLQLYSRQLNASQRQLSQDSRP